MSGDSSPAPQIDSSATTDDYSTPLLEALFTKQHRKLQPAASMVFGVTGIVIYALAISSIAGELLLLAIPLYDEHPIGGMSVKLLFAAMVYPAVVLTLQLLTTSCLPFALRLLLAITVLYACLRLAFYRMGGTTDQFTVLACLPICFGGFIQHRLGWKAIACRQKAKAPGRLSIAMMLDWTAACAVILGVFSTARMTPNQLLSFVLIALLMSALGMHVWGRLTALCIKKKDRDIGVAMWVLGNTVIGCIVFMVIALNGLRPISALLSIIVAPAMVLIAQLVTAVPIAWLKACGWKLVRVQQAIMPPSN